MIRIEAIDIWTRAIRPGTIVKVQRTAIEYTDSHGVKITAYAETPQEAERLHRVHMHSVTVQ